jgi:Flp pilus assembly protein TadB
VSISTGKYGQISKEFGVVVSEVKAGKPLIQALEDLAMKNPSPHFQRVIWQVANTIKAGGNLAENLNDITRTISRDQVNSIRTYGGRLSPLSMAYMMSAVIAPSLGTTVLITLSSLPGMSANFNEGTFWWILIITIILQIQFAMIIKSVRPNLVGE